MATTPKPTAAQLIAQLGDQYPVLANLLKIPELQDFLTQVADNPAWTPGQVQAALFATPWWKTTPENARAWEILKVTDPKTASQKAGETAAKVQRLAIQMGVPFNAQQIAFTTEVAIQNAWDDQTLANKILANLREGQEKAGSVAAAETSVRAVAADYGINLGDHAAFNWGKRIVEGQGDTAAFAEYAKDQAKISHPYWEKQLDAGHTLRQLADPYIQEASRLLEVSPDAINLANPKWDFAQPDKNGDRKPMSQADWSTHLMNDTRFGWDRTANAKDAAFQVVDQLRQSFGAA